MRILLVANLFPPEFADGYQLAALDLATWLATRGHAVAVATSALIRSAQDLVDPPFALHRTLDHAALRLDPAGEADLLRDSFISLANVSALARIVAGFQPDRVLLCGIAGLGPLGVVAFLAELGFGPLLYLGDNPFGPAANDPDRLAAFRRLFGAERALAGLRVAAVSQEILSETQGSLGMAFNAPFFVPGWVPPDLPPLPPGEPGQALRFAFVSHASAAGAIGIVLDAMRLLQASGETGFEVDVYGTGDATDFVQQASAAGLEGKLRHAGEVPREAMLRRLATYDALLCPTWRHEPAGVLAFDAAAQGCLPIIPADCGAAEWLLAGDCIKTERGPQSLAAGMARLMHMPLAERLAMRARTSRGARRMFAAGRWLSRIEAALAAQPGAAPGCDPWRARDAMAATTRIWKG